MTHQVELSPLHRAVLGSLTSGLSREDCAAAVFLIAHREFDSRALAAAAAIYRALPGGRGQVVSEALREECERRLASEVELLRTSGQLFKAPDTKGNG